MNRWDGKRIPFVGSTRPEPFIEIQVIMHYVLIEMNFIEFHTLNQTPPQTPQLRSKCRKI